MKKLVYIFLLLVTSSLVEMQRGYAQNREIDSLQTLLKKDKEDTSKVKNLNEICWEYYLIGEYNNGLICGKQALILAENLGLKKDIATSYHNIGNIYRVQGNHPEALKNNLSALKIFEEIGDKKAMANSYNNIGILYCSQSNYADALKNSLIALKIREEIGDIYGVAVSYNNIGIIYGSQGNYPEASKNYFATLKMCEKMSDKLGVANSHNNIGLCYSLQGNYSESLKHYFTSLNIYNDYGAKGGIALSYNNIGNLYVLEGNSIKGKGYLLKGLAVALEIGSLEEIKESYAGLAKADSAFGNYKDALQHYKLFIAYRDSLFNEENTKKTVQQQMQYEFDKKEGIAKAEQDKKDAIANEEKQKQRIILFFVIAGLLLVVVFSIFLYNRFKITQRQKLIIEKQKLEVDEAYDQLHEKNKEVMDSIYYARRIQRSLLTSENYIARELNKLMKKH